MRRKRENPNTFILCIQIPPDTGWNNILEDIHYVIHSLHHYFFAFKILAISASSLAAAF